MRNGILFSVLALLSLAGGCAKSQFAGEWVQESVVNRDGTLSAVSGERRLALQFIPPSSVRLGMFVDAAGVVEADTVSSSDYQTIQDRSVAQFGAYTARVENGELVAFIGGEEKGRFRKVKGESVFPPIVKLPQLVRADAPAVPFEPVIVPEVIAGAPSWSTAPLVAVSGE